MAGQIIDLKLIVFLLGKESQLKRAYVSVCASCFCRNMENSALKKISGSSPSNESHNLPCARKKYYKNIMYSFRQACRNTVK